MKLVPVSTDDLGEAGGGTKQLDPRLFFGPFKNPGNKPGGILGIRIKRAKHFVQGLINGIADAKGCHEGRHRLLYTIVKKKESSGLVRSQ